MAFELAKAFVAIEVNASKLRTGLDSALSMVTKSVFSMKGAIATALGGFGAIATTKWMLGLAADAEQLDIALNTIIKDMDKTKALVADIEKMAWQTPFDVNDIKRSAQSMVQLGIPVKDVTDSLRMLGDLAAGAGGDLGVLANAYGKIRGAGRLTGDVEQSFAAQGIFLSELIKKSGVLTGEYETMRKKGTITFDMVAKALKHATGEQGLFFNAMLRQSDSIKGLWEGVQEKISNVGLAFGKAMMPAAKGIARAFIDLLDEINPKIESLAKMLEEKLFGLELFIRTAFTTIGENFTQIVDLMRTTWDMFSVDFIATAQRMGWELRRALIPTYWDMAAATAEKISDLRIASLEKKLNLFRDKWPDDKQIPNIEKALQRERDLKKTTLDEFRRRNEQGAPQSERADWQLLEFRQLGMLSALSAAWSEARGKIEGEMKESRKPLPDMPKPGFSRVLLKWLGETLPKMPEFKIPLFHKGMDVSDLSGKGRWNRMMGFEDLHRTIQEAFLEEENPVEETNRILINHTELFRRMGGQMGKTVGKLDQLLAQGAKQIGTGIGNLVAKE